ncbi:MAG TPA: HlyD family efflux transporter periplasmic adaptor subunit [Bacteroidota bacterium]|nr:HlyD family efflux transporter periplasmic adaptor subunit [Bacteroidota bacterium]
MGTHAFRRTFLLRVAASALVLVSSCSTPKQDDDTEAVPGAPVKISHPAVSSMIESIDCNATTTFMKKEIVRSTFQGYIQETTKTPGDRINVGEPLFFLKTKEGVATDSITGGATASDALGRGAIAVTAKSAGVVAELNFHPGEYVTEGEQLAVIANPASLAVLLNVPYQDAAKIRIGARCKLSLPGGRNLAGTVTRALPSVDPVSQTQSFLVHADAMANLPANLILAVSIPVHEVRNAVVVPTRAVLSSETLDKFWIMKLTNDTTAVKVTVTKGAQNDSLVQILAPVLNANDRILVEGGYGLPDTARVSLQN